MNQYRVLEYSCDKRDYELKMDRPDVHYIVDKLIRLTAKITSFYGSDIIYDLDDFRKAVDNNSNYLRMLEFRENGIHSMELIQEGLNIFCQKDYCNTDAHERWLLEVISGEQTPSACLRRVYLHQ